MADTFTANLNLTLPEIGASDDSWGDKLNDNSDKIDVFFGTSGEGTVIVRDANNDALVSGINLTRAAGNARTIRLRSDADIRWDFGADATAETGGDVGSIFKINRYSDAGGLLGTPLQIDRATGLITFASTPKVGSNEMLHQGNLSNIAVPLGATLFWDVDTLPYGYIWKNGVLQLRASYPELFALYGTKFGAGDGATTFGIPNWCEVVPIGKSTMGGIAARGLITDVALTDTAAAPVGIGKNTISQDNLPVLNFVVDIPAGQGLHSHGYNGGTQIGGATGRSGGDGQGAVLSPGTLSINNATLPAMTGTAASGGSGTQIDNLQPSVVCNYIIKALP